MPPKKESPAEKAARLTKNATEATQKVDLNLVVCSIKYHAPAVSSVKAHLLANGWLLTHEQLEDISKKEAKKALTNTQEDSTGAPSSSPNLPLQDRPDLQVEIHRNFKKWNKMPPAHMTVLLSVIQPMAFNVAVLRSLRRKGQREVHITVLCEYLERECGIDPSSDIGERRWLWEIAEDLLKRSASMGSPCSNMKLPADWGGPDGAYSLSVQQDTIWLVREGIAMPIDPRDLNNCPYEDLRIENNFSVQRASVRSASDPSLCQPCVILHVKGLSIKPRFTQASQGPLALTNSCSSSTGGTIETPAAPVAASPPKKQPPVARQLSPSLSNAFPSPRLHALGEDPTQQVQQEIVKQAEASPNSAAGGEFSDDEPPKGDAVADDEPPQGGADAPGVSRPAFSIAVKPEMRFIPPLPKRLRQE